MKLWREQSCIEFRYFEEEGYVCKGREELKRIILLPLPPVSSPKYSNFRVILKALEWLCESWKKQFTGSEGQKNIFTYFLRYFGESLNILLKAQIHLCYMLKRPEIMFFSWENFSI